MAGLVEKRVKMPTNTAQMSTIVIFDLDDTLVNANCRVPRQTYHMLNRFRKRGYHIGISSFNPMLPFVCATTGLGKYAMALAHGDIDRDELFFSMFGMHSGPSAGKRMHRGDKRKTRRRSKRRRKRRGRRKRKITTNILLR